MGKVTVTARIENIGDLHDVDEGRISADKVRRLEIKDALVDTGASGLHVPKSELEKLGLKYLRSGKSLTAMGVRETRIFGRALLTVQGRECPTDITELPDGCPTLIGQIPLQVMDFVVDPRNQRIIGNPAHGGEQVVEIY